MSKETTQQLLQRVTAEVTKKHVAGTPQLFLVKEYEENRGEFLHFETLLQYDVFTSLIFDVSHEIKTLFPVDSLVWVFIEQLKDGKKGIRVREATQENEQAVREYKQGLIKMYAGSSSFTKVTLDGQNRILGRKDS